MSNIRVEVAQAEHADVIAAFFAAAGSTCFCRYWHFTGDKNAWLERAAFSPDAGEQELRAAIAAGHASAMGLCAIEPATGRVVGWLKLAPLETLPKLRMLNVYRRLDIEEDGSFAIGCILVHPAHRNLGVARELIRGAIEHAAKLGATRLLAFPRRAESRLHDEEAWMGPYATYLTLGFEVALGEDPYPVLRHPLHDHAAT